MTGRVIPGPWPSISIRRRETGPAAAYLAERERLGIPSQVAILTRRCPWCHARPGEPCRVRATGWRITSPHHSRTGAAS